MSSYYEKVLATGEVKCIDEEIPFEIPQGWEWCRLGTIAEIIGGYAFPSLMLKGDTGTRVIRISDFTEHGLTKSRIVRYNGVAISDLYTIQISDILMAMTGGTVGKSCYIKSLPEKLLLNQRVAVIRNQYMNSEYINLIVESPHIIAFVNDRKNSTNDNISMKDIYNFLIPIPSIKQQERIVNAFNSIRPIIKRFAQVQENKEKLQNEVKDKLRKSILHEAIQGKLVPQISEEGTAQDLLQVIKEEKQKLFKEGKLKKSALNDSVIFRSDDNKYYEQIGKKCVDITEQIPFEIPNSWTWARMGQVGDWGAGSTPQRGNQDYYGGNILWLKTGELNNGIVYDTEEKITQRAFQDCSLRMNKIGDVLIAMYGATIGKLAIVGKELTTNQACCGCTPYVVFNWYLFYFLMASRDTFIKKGEGGAQPNISRVKLVEHLIPLPPLREQKRIVQKIEQLMQLLK